MWGEHVDATNLLSRCAAAEWHFFWLPVTTLASCRLGSSTSNKLPPARPHCSSAFTPHGTYGVQHNPTRAVSVTSVCLILCVCVCVCCAQHLASGLLRRRAPMVFRIRQRYHRRQAATAPLPLPALATWHPGRAYLSRWVYIGCALAGR